MDTIETYADGHLIETRYVDINPVPNIANFNTQMMLAQSYSRLANSSSSQEFKNRLEIASVRLELKNQITNEDLTIFKFIWDTVVDGVPEGILTFADRDEFNQIAEFNNMPFRFGDDFKMLVGSE